MKDFVASEEVVICDWVVKCVGTRNNKNRFAGEKVEMAKEILDLSDFLLWSLHKIDGFLKSNTNTDRHPKPTHIHYLKSKHQKYGHAIVFSIHYHPVPPPAPIRHFKPKQARYAIIFSIH